MWRVRFFMVSISWVCPFPAPACPRVCALQGDVGFSTVLLMFGSQSRVRHLWAHGEFLATFRFYEHLRGCDEFVLSSVLESLSVNLLLTATFELTTHVRHLITELCSMVFMFHSRYRIWVTFTIFEAFQKCYRCVLINTHTSVVVLLKQGVIRVRP